MVVFHLHPNWNFRIFLVNSIQSLSKPRDLPRLDRAIKHELKEVLGHTDRQSRIIKDKGLLLAVQSQIFIIYV